MAYATYHHLMNGGETESCQSRSSWAWRNSGPATRCQISLSQLDDREHGFMPRRHYILPGKVLSSGCIALVLYLVFMGWNHKCGLFPRVPKRLKAIMVSDVLSEM